MLKRGRSHRDLRWSLDRGGYVPKRPCPSEGRRLWMALRLQEMESDSDTDCEVHTQASSQQTDSTEYEVRSMEGGEVVDWENVSIGSSPQYVLLDRSGQGSWQWVEGSCDADEEGKQGKAKWVK